MADKRDRKRVGIGALVALGGLLFRFFGPEAINGLGFTVTPGGLAAWWISVALSVPPLAYAVILAALGLGWCFWNTLNAQLLKFSTWIVTRRRSREHAALSANESQREIDKAFRNIRILLAILVIAAFVASALDFLLMFTHSSATIKIAP